MISETPQCSRPSQEGRESSYYKGGIICNRECHEVFAAAKESFEDIKSEFRTSFCEE